MLRCAVVLLFLHCYVFGLLTEEAQQDMGQAGLDVGHFSLQGMKDAAEELASKEWPVEASCLAGEHPKALCEMRADILERDVFRSETAQAGRVFHSLFVDGIRTVEDLADESLDSIDLDLDKREFNTDFCSSTWFGENSNYVDDTTCISGTACSQLNGPVTQAGDGLTLKKMTLTLAHALSTGPRTTQNFEAAYTSSRITLNPEHNTVADLYEGNKPFHTYLFLQLAFLPDLHWAYYGDNSSNLFLGYKRDLHTGDKVYTYGSSEGLFFFSTDKNGKPVSQTGHDPTWAMKERLWYVTGWNGLDPTNPRFTTPFKWTDVYSFSPPKDNDVGISSVSRVTSEGVAGADFYLNGFVHRFLDKVKLHKDSVFFVMNDKGVHMASNKVAVTNGVSVQAVDVPYAEIAQTAKYLIEHYPSLVDSSQSDYKKAQLAYAKFMTIDIGGTTWRVSVTAPVELFGWSVTYMVPVGPHEPIPSETNKCITKIGCATSVGGSVLEWRKAFADAKNTHLQILEQNAREVVLSIDVDRDTSLAHTSTAADLRAKLDQFPMDYVHIVNTKTRTIEAAVNRVADNYYELKCVDDCTSGQLYDGTTPVEDNVAIDWKWYGLASRLPAGHLKGFHVLYDLHGQKAHSYVLIDPSRPDVVINVGYTLSTYRKYLSTYANEGTVVYVMDNVLRLKGASVGAWPPRASSDQAHKHVYESARALQHHVVDIVDEYVRSLEVPTDEGTLFVDYRRMGTGPFHTAQSYSVLVIVRQTHQVAVSSQGLPKECIPCSASTVSMEVRKQVLQEAVDETRDALHTPPRAVLATDAYMQAGYLDASDPAAMLKHFKKQLNTYSATLSWVGIYDVATFSFIGTLDSGKQENTALGALWMTRGTAMYKERDDVPPKDLWAWSAMETIGTEVMMLAVRPVIRDDSMVGVLVAGVSLAKIKNSAFKHLSTEHIVVLSATGTPLFSTMPDADAQQMAEKYTKLYPATEFSWTTEGVVTHKALANGTLTVYGDSEIVHMSEGWAHNKNKVRYSIRWRAVSSAIEEYKEGVCVQNAECGTLIEQRLVSLRSKVLPLMEEALRVDEARIKECVTMEFADHYVNIFLQNTLTNVNKHKAMKFLAYHLTLFPEVSYLALHSTNHNDRFISLYRKEGSPNEFRAWYCWAHKCHVNKISQTGELGSILLGHGIDLSQGTIEYWDLYIAQKTKITEQVNSGKLVFKAGGFSSTELVEKLKSVDMVGGSVLYLHDKTTSEVIANRGDADDLVQTSKSLTVSPTSSIKTISHALAGVPYEISYMAYRNWVLVVVQQKENTDKVNFDVTLAHNPTCSEQGLCAEQIDDLRELDYTAKADFIAIRTARYFKLLQSAIAQLPVSTWLASPLGEIFSSTAEYVKTMQYHVAGSKSISAAYLTDGTVHCYISDATVVWQNSTGVYEGSSVTSTLAPIEEWNPPDVGHAAGWIVTSDAISVRADAGEGSVAIISNAELLVGNVLEPFEGAVLLPSGATVASNTICQNALKDLTDTTLLANVKADLDVSIRGQCALDARTVRGAHPEVVVLSMESDVHANDYPNVAGAYGCVTWEACSAAAETARIKLMDTIVRHVFSEYKVAEAEFRRLSSAVSINEQLVTAHHITWIADVSNGFRGFLNNKTNDKIYNLECLSPACTTIGVWAQLSEVATMDPLYTFEAPVLVDGEITATADYIYFKKGKLAAAVPLSSLAYGVDGYSKVQFEHDTVQRDTIKEGDVVHRTVGPTTTVTVKAGDVLIQVQHTASFFVATGTSAPCVVDCEKELRLFEGVDLSAKAAVVKLQQTLKIYDARLAILGNGLTATAAGDIDVEAELLCSFFPQGDVSVGWYNGTVVHQCERRKNKIKTSTTTDTHSTWMRNNVYKGRLWFTKTLNVGIVAIKVDEIDVSLTYLAPALSMEIGLKRNGVLVLGAEKAHNVEISIPAMTTGSTFWAISATAVERAILRPPNYIGCFTQLACECEKSSFTRDFSTTVSTLQQQVSDSIVTTVQSAAKSISDAPNQIFTIASHALDQAFIMEAAKEAYTGYIRRDSSLVSVSCSSTACTALAVTADGESYGEPLSVRDIPTYTQLVSRLGDSLLYDGRKGYLTVTEGTIQIVAGVSFDTLVEALTSLEEAIPEGSTMFLVDQKSGSLLQQYSNNEKVKTLETKCRDAIYGAKPESCINGDSAYSVSKVQGGSDVAIVTFIYRPSKELSKDSSTVVALLQRVENDFEKLGPTAFSLYYQSSLGNIVGIMGRNPGIFAKIDVKAVLEVHRKAQRQKTWWLEVRADKNNIILRRGVNRGGKFIGLVTVVYELGKEMNNRLKSYHGGSMYVFSQDGIFLGTSADTSDPSYSFATFNLVEVHRPSLYTLGKHSGQRQAYMSFVDPVFIVVSNAVTRPTTPCLSASGCELIISSMTTREMRVLLLSSMESTFLSMDAAESLLNSLQWYVNSTVLGGFLKNIRKHESDVLKILQTRGEIYGVDSVMVDVGYPLGVQKRDEVTHTRRCSAFVDGSDVCRTTSLYDNAGNVVETTPVKLVRDASTAQDTTSWTLKQITGIFIEAAYGVFSIGSFVPAQVSIVVDPATDTLLKDSGMGADVLAHMQSTGYKTATGLTEGVIPTKEVAYMFTPVARGEVKLFYVIVKKIEKLPGQDVSPTVAGAVPDILHYLENNPWIAYMSFTSNNDTVGVTKDMHLTAAPDATDPENGWARLVEGRLAYCMPKATTPQGVVCASRDTSDVSNDMALWGTGYLMLTHPEGDTVHPKASEVYTTLQEYEVHTNTDIVHHPAEDLYVTMDSSQYAPWVMRYASRMPSAPRHASDAAKVTSAVMAARLAERAATVILARDTFSTWGMQKLQDTPQLMFIGRSKGSGYLRDPDNAGEVLFVGCRDKNMECGVLQLWKLNQATGDVTGLAGALPPFTTDPLTCKLGDTVSRAFSNFAENPAAPTVVCSMPPPQGVLLLIADQEENLLVGGRNADVDNQAREDLSDLVFGQGEGRASITRGKNVTYLRWGVVVAARMMDRAGLVVLDMFLEMTFAEFKATGGKERFRTELMARMAGQSVAEGVEATVTAEANGLMTHVTLTLKTTEGWEQDLAEVASAFKAGGEALNASTWHLVARVANTTRAPETVSPGNLLTPSPTPEEGKGTILVVILVVAAGLSLLAFVIISQLRTPRLVKRRSEYTESGFPDPPMSDDVELPDIREAPTQV
eukprot:TRINITY_DN1812_c0_g1_i2.p1 TRINITY_DN1812_c0_g1~~TRINITY_DN1812_c0_g1_i2.p1  ORF type:complete len:3194 (+),score=633.91 TRINITY_DN1812_c0_g1_i2:1026-10607(+)